MRGTFFSRLRTAASKLLRDQRGNAMMLTAAAIVPVIGIVGSGIDIGRAYMAQLRLQQACDAGVLAGRRYMGAASYGDKAKAEATKMFDFNYPREIYGSKEVSFNSQPQGASDVVGTATARLPAIIMRFFGFGDFNLAVNCAAKLEISNVDVMLVLDVTGSMKDPGTGTQSRIDELKEASMTFFKTITQADKGDGRLRIGVVPYSSTVNVGQILVQKNADWIANNVTLTSRKIDPAGGWQTGTTVNGTASNNTATVVSGLDWAAVTPSQTKTGKNATTCPQTAAPANGATTANGSSTTQQVSQGVDSSTGNRVTQNNVKQDYRYVTYRYAWVSSTCRLESRTMQYTQTTPQTVTQPPVRYVYQDISYPVASFKTGGALVTATGVNGVNETNYWNGCIMERQTTSFAANATAPASALDMDIDTKPDASNANTQWKVLIPEIAYSRSQYMGNNKPSTTGALNVPVGNVKYDGSGNPMYMSYYASRASGWGACPAAAMKLTTVSASDETTFQTYINSLQPIGGTYHDVGIAWGARLLSPTGILADENATASNGRPIDRHIIFMTDGAMSPDMGNLSFQGYEYIDQHVQGTSNPDKASLTSLHNNRFVQLCNAAKQRGITIWVVALSTSLTQPMKDCATAGKSFETVNKNGKKIDLSDIFESIAGQISRLRLSQ